MNQPFLRFLQAVRGAGVRVSVSESIDAFKTLDLIGYGDRQLLKDSLGLVLAKTEEEKLRFAECFELYFTRKDFAGAPSAQERQAADHEASGDSETPLGRMLLSGDQAGLATAMEAAANAAQVSEISFFTQTNIYARRIMESMGLEPLEAEIRRLRALGTPEAEATAEALDRGRTYLGQQVREFMERQLAVYAQGKSRALRDDFLQNTRLSNLDRRDFQRMKVIVRAMAKRLATRHARIKRTARRGQLDVRRMIRHNMHHDGMMFRTAWKKRKIERPRVVAICDVSGSVAAVAQFLLLFLYSLNEVLSDIRSFAFSSSLIEVSEILERQGIEDAIAQILKDIGFGSTNYGRALADFKVGWIDKVDNKTTVIIIGDARGNYTDPRLDIMKSLYERAKRVIWLNPEYQSSWGSGDSDMLRYRPFCHLAAVCNSVRHLERCLTALLED